MHARTTSQSIYDACLHCMTRTLVAHSVAQSVTENRVLLVAAVPVVTLACERYALIQSNAAGSPHVTPPIAAFYAGRLEDVNILAFAVALVQIGLTNPALPLSVAPPRAQRNASDLEFICTPNEQSLAGERGCARNLVGVCRGSVSGAGGRLGSGATRCSCETTLAMNFITCHYCSQAMQCGVLQNKQDDLPPSACADHCNEKCTEQTVLAQSRRHHCKRSNGKPFFISFFFKGKRTT